ncbi:bacillithiol biosynthesis deacetylase BshB1 [Parapedobacter koreensis]|uniref:Bacillithiol biosynthesis deacetylase BshB1 n=1 Tax=Parapedobacter koreensis TaxID=332977 RepID=A0A1H7TSJ7_9SPHI|nr:bacillithiol biosynthesis deacetylase BshB1 [Parapedobacter koreensis]SEL87711.1 bacillithiol biosynthesis deacetylase BshB1 [Parapedobacter koreensis]
MEENNKLDILIIAVHPDDAELGCGGTILKHVAMGKKVGIVDLTRGELGTRGTPESRHEEARHAAAVLGLSVRENLGMRDGFFRNDESHQLQVVQSIRKYRPEIIISNALYDRHPDHGRSGDLVNDAVFLAGLRKIETIDEGSVQVPHRPRLVLQLIQDYYIKPDIVVDVSDHWEGKINAIKAFKSQFHNEAYASNEPETYISRPDFLEYIEGRAREYGKYIGAKYAEGFTCRRLLGVDDLFALK